MVVFPPLEDATTVNLSVHMLQHVFIVAAGALFGYSLYKNKKSRKGASGQEQLLGVVGMAVILPLVIYWHALEHSSFLAVGILVGLLVPMLPIAGMAGVMFLDYVGHTYYAFILATSKVPVYALYSVGQQSTLSLFILGYSSGLLVVYILASVYLHFSRQAQKMQAIHATDMLASFRYVGHRRRATIVASLVIIMTLVAYFGVVAVSLSAASSQQHQQSVTVYIDESFVSWQYSPQSIRVVMGVNNTVTWVSRSISFDTVTGTNDSSFSSSPIAPGQGFIFTFYQPGTYPYYCIYHLWMRGSVTVASA